MLKGEISKASFQIFFAMLFVALIMFMSNYLVFRNSTVAIFEQTRKNNELIVKNIVKSFDGCFKDINNTIYDVNSLKYQVYDYSENNNLNMSNIFLLLNDAKQMISQDYIYDFVLYFND